MEVDSVFLKGSSHLVCEDYTRVLRKIFGGVVAVVSDGCSASPHTDFGARLIACSAANLVGAKTEKPMADEEFWRSVAKQAAELASDSCMSVECIDATALVLLWHEDKVSVGAMGDGWVCALHRNGALDMWHISEEHSLPGYPSYLLNTGNRKALREVSKHKTISHYTLIEGELFMTEEQVDPLKPFTVEFHKAGTASVAVLSDGANSFTYPGGNIMPPMVAVVELMDFKQYKGEFVKRRVLSVTKKWRKMGIGHYDDLSMAAIYMG